VGLQHRYRLEQRYLGQKIQPSDSCIDFWRYENRFRYMMRINLPLEEEKKLYLGVYDEIMVNFGNKSGRTSSTRTGPMQPWDIP